MKKILLDPLLSGVTSAVNAETYLLSVKTYACGDGFGAALEKIEMASMDQRLKSGKVWVSSNDIKYNVKEITKHHIKALSVNK